MDWTTQAVGQQQHTTILAISHYSNKTARPSPVMFWTAKAPFWYTLVAPRPMEEPALFALGSHPAGVPGRLGAHPERPRPALRAGLAAPPTPLRTCAQCLLGRTLFSALLPPLHFVCVCVLGRADPGD